MVKMIRIVEVMWLVIAALSLTEVYRSWNVDNQRAYISLAFVALGIFMFWFRRRSRLRYESRVNEDENS